MFAAGAGLDEMTAQVRRFKTIRPEARHISFSLTSRQLWPGV